jgi:hypothetical protein
MPGLDEVDLETEAQVTDAEREAESEDALMFAGKTVSVAETDDHEVHIIVHQEALTQAPDETYTIIDNHIEEHKAFMSPRLAPLMGRSVLDNGISPMAAPQLGEELIGGMNEKDQNPGELPAGPGGEEIGGGAPETGGQNQGDGGIL